MRIYTDSDADLARLTERKVAIVGYGGQGHAHALNLRDSGVGDLVVALCPNSPTRERATAAGFPLMTASEAAVWADVLMILAPDEDQPRLWAEEIAPHLRAHSEVGFAHGLAVHFGYIAPPDGTNVFLIAPKGPGHQLRAQYEKGLGLPCLLAVNRAEAMPTALAYGAALGCGRSAMIETSFAEECVTDLFGEQAVLCGGIPDLIRAGYETLVEAGYAPEMAYFECAHEAKLIVDLIYESGLAAMRSAISNTAEFGGYATGARLVTDETRAEMRHVLDDIRSGRFAERLMADHAAGDPLLERHRREGRADPIEPVGLRVRALLPWIGEQALIRD